MVERKARKTRGDVFRINITPAANTFPWIKIFRHPYGIRKAGREVRGAGGRNDSRRKTALMIGESIIHNSKVLSAWFK
jgi:hypothetical protein